MMKWKIGVALVLLILFLPMIANAEETTKVYSIEEIITYKQKGWDVDMFIGYDAPTIGLDLREIKVGENVLINGSVCVDLVKDNGSLGGHISNYPFGFQIYKNEMDLDLIVQISDDNGEFSASFIPKEYGYYKAVVKSPHEWMPYSSGFPPLDDSYNKNPIYFYISEKDSDGDGVPDQYDYDSYDPNIQSRSDIKTPAFEAIFAIVGLLAVAYLLRRRR
ncbi:MAG: hypothetical protein KAT65_14480 [Methanophagales archaeon]|nr:hypothetical protein [Methanophagales archaeon]